MDGGDDLDSTRSPLLYDDFTDQYASVYHGGKVNVSQKGFGRDVEGDYSVEEEAAIETAQRRLFRDKVPVSNSSHQVSQLPLVSSLKPVDLSCFVLFDVNVIER